MAKIANAIQSESVGPWSMSCNLCDDGDSDQGTDETTSNHRQCSGANYLAARDNRFR